MRAKIMHLMPCRAQMIGKCCLHFNGGMIRGNGNLHGCVKSRADESDARLLTSLTRNATAQEGD
jgi:hypothetical protein